MSEGRWSWRIFPHKLQDLLYALVAVGLGLRNATGYWYWLNIYCRFCSNYTLWVLVLDNG